jgi:hypothetical protein
VAEKNDMVAVSTHLGLLEPGVFHHQFGNLKAIHAILWLNGLVF